MQRLYNVLKKNKALNHAMTLLSWDLETQAPKNGVATIADTMEVLSEMSYKLMVNDEFKNLLYSYNVDELSEIDKKIVEKLKETIFEKTSKIPIDEYSNYQSLIANSNNAWEYAKENNDFNHFKPYLEKLILTNKKFIGYIGYKDHPYNKLLDDYEKGITVEYCDKFFNKLKTELSPFIIKVQAKKDGIIKPIKEKFDKVVFSIEEQKKISIELAKILGFDFTKGVLSESEHPFTTNMSNKDVRMTTHYYLNDVLSAIYSTCHETGHSIYEQQISDEISATIVLAEGASMGMHEAQSRLYENVLCKLNSFTDLVYDILSKYHKLPITKAEFYILVNEVKHQYIRIEADELTYPMHVLIRYEIEKDMFSNLDNNINIDELSKKWDNLYEKYLGIRPKDYKQGILQDSHWAAGLFGYFPSYALGSAYASQIYDSMIKEIDVEKDIANRDFSKINEFLREKIHKFGASKTPEELLNICTNKNFDENHYIKYLINKYSSIYNVED